MSEGEKFEQQSFLTKQDEGEVKPQEVGEPAVVVEKSEFKDIKEEKVFHFEKGSRVKTSSYTGKSCLFLQDAIIATPVEGKKDKQGFAPFRFLANANPEVQDKEWVQASRDNFNHRFNLDTNSILKLPPREGTVRKAKDYLKNHRIGLSTEDMR